MRLQLQIPQGMERSAANACIAGEYMRAIELANIATYGGVTVKSKNGEAEAPLPTTFPAYLDITINSKPLSAYVG